MMLNGKTIPSSVSSSLSDRIASCALSHYNTQLPEKKGKPKRGQEWTVFAAFVAFRRVDNHMWVVSSATGTKCTAKRYNGCILHDAHAEVLARRGLIRVILSEIAKCERRDMKIGKTKFNEKQKKNKDTVNNDIISSPDLLMKSSLLSSAGTNEMAQQKQHQYKHQLDPSLEIHLYISDSPCGDASIYPIEDMTNDGNNSNKSFFTGAKVIVSEATRVGTLDCGGNHQLLPVMKINVPDIGNDNKKDDDEENNNEASIIVVAREVIQVLSKLRTKSGRSNLPFHMRSHSHSCSDKIVSWSLLGLQGALLTKMLDPPIIPLTSVVVSRDSRLKQWQHQLAALERAISSRSQSVLEFLSSKKQEKLPSWIPFIPTVYIVSEVFVSGKAAMIARPETKLTGEKRKHFGNESEETGGIGKNTIIDSKISPCGVAFNWNQNEGIEVLVGARGLLHGKKPKTPEDNEKLASRLCRAKLVKDFFLESSARELKLDEGGEHSLTIDSKDENDSSTVSSNRTETPKTTYNKHKKEAACREWILLKNRILTQDGSPLAGWLRNSTGDDNFVLTGEGNR